MTTDPIQPFRDEIERHYEMWGDGKTGIGMTYLSILGRCPFTEVCGTPEQIILGYEEATGVGCLATGSATQNYRAAKALQIAETEGPDAALLWKLAN